MTIHAYCRVSSKKQVDKEGLKSQKTALQSHIDSVYTNEKVIWYTEKGVSGTTSFEERPEMVRLLENLKEGDTIVAREVSRISRIVWYGAEFLRMCKERKIGLSCLNAINATDNAQAAFVYHIMLAAAENELANIVERTSLGREEVRKAGGDLGGRPKPWQKRDKDKNAVNCPVKISLLLKIQDLFNSGATGKQISEQTGISAPTISRYAKQMSDTTSEMYLFLKDQRQK